jgi:hypothetical protein
VIPAASPVVPIFTPVVTIRRRIKGLAGKEWAFATSLKVSP